MASVDDLKAFNGSVLAFRDKWQQLQSKFHQFISTDPNGKPILDNSFDISKPELHLPAFQKVSTLMRDFDRDSAQDVIDLWPSALRYVTGRSSRLTKEHIALFGSANILCGILLASGNLYKALRIMVDMLQAGETSPKISLAALAVAIELEELELYAEIRKIVPRKAITGVFLQWLEALDLDCKVRLSKTKGGKHCSEVYAKLAKLSQEKTRTYAMCYTEIALRNALIHLVKQSSANIQNIGDPLYHLHRCHDVVYGGMHGLFSDTVVSNGQMRMFEDEQPTLSFDKFFLFHQYCSITGRFIHELVDCGRIEEAEQRFVPCLKYTLFSCIPYRLLSAVNVFYLIRRLVIFKNENTEQVGKWVDALCSIEYDWVLQQEQAYSTAIANNFSTRGYNSLYDLRKPAFVEQFGRREIAMIFKNDALNDPQQPLPLSLAANLFRATVHFLLQAYGKGVKTAKHKELTVHILKICSRAETFCRSQWLMLRQLDRLQLPAPQLSWIRTTKSDAKLPTVKEVNDCVTDAYPEYKRFRHLYYVQWRRLCGTYIATNVEQAMQSPRPDHVAMLLSESMAIPLRAAMRIRETEHVHSKRLEYELNEAKQSEEEDLVAAIEKLKIDDANSSSPKFPTGFFDGSDAFRAFIAELPGDITALQFSFDSNHILWLTRYHCDHEPYSIPLCSTISPSDQRKTDFDLLLERLEKILNESDSVVSGGTSMDAKAFWLKRRALNKEMEDLVGDMQSEVLGKLTPLCRPFGPNATRNQKALKVQKELEALGFLRNTATILTHLIDYVEKDEWTELIPLMAERENSIKSEPFVNVDSLSQVEFSSLKLNLGSRQDRCKGESYIFLVLPPSLSTIPWECMPVFQNALITRIPSLYTLKALLVKHEKIPKYVDARNSFYVLNPAGNLPATQQRLEGVLAKMKWQGVVGEAPRKEDLMEALKSQDMYVFLGHGSGRRYFGNGLRQLDCRPVCLLMGCSSVAISQEGHGYDGRSSVYDFMLAHCPCLVGCLWMVTDGEADRFFMELINFCFEELQQEPNETIKSGPETPKSLTKTPTRRRAALIRPDDACRFIMRGIARARHACKLPFLTGGSVVSYGLPTFAQY